MSNGIPTLDEVFQRWLENRENLSSVIIWFELIATGKAPPKLEDNNAIFAAQTVLVLINHFLELEKSNAATKTTTTKESNNSQEHRIIVDPPT